MNKIKWPTLLNFIFFLSIAFPAQADQTNIQKPFEEILCQEILQSPPHFTSNYSDYFSETFREAIPLDSLLNYFASFAKDVGPCAQVVSSFQNGQSSQNKLTTLSTTQNILLRLRISLDSSSGLITGLYVDSIDDPKIKIQTWQDFDLFFRSMDTATKTSDYAITLTTPDLSIQYNLGGQKALAIGSGFKLFVLGALVSEIAKGHMHWNQKLAVQEKWRSLGEGGVNQLPAGTELSLFDFALSMISISDNSAADHLLGFLGRKNVETMQESMGNEHYWKNLPFLSTSEIFKLKWALLPAQTESYLLSDIDEKREYLEYLEYTPLTDIGKNGVPTDQPTLIDQLEWYATPDENCKALFWLAQQNSTEVRSILSENVPAIDLTPETSHWAYAGYKGGSEPGVIQMSFLLESKRGNRACLSFEANNKSENFSTLKILDIITKTLKLAETIIP